MSLEKNGSPAAFLRRALHDLNSPVRHIHLFTDMLRESLAESQISDTSQEYLDVIQRASAQMKGVLESLGNFLRLPESADQTAPIDVASLLQHCWEEASSQIDGSLSAKMETDGTAGIASDPKLLSKMVVEIFRNSMRFRNPSRSLQVGCQVRQEHDRCRIQIRDNGIGIEPGFLDRVIEPFESLPAEGVQRSAGLGLALCRKVANLLDGSISLSSDGSSGTTVEVELPLER